MIEMESKQETKTPKVAVVVLNWNGWQDTIECLESLLKLSYPSYQVIVVDNGSSDGSVEKIRVWVKEKCPSLALIETKKNLGYAGGNNIGIRYALVRGDFDYVWVLNNDTVVHPDALTHLVRRMKEKPDAGMCGSTILYHHDPKKVWAQGAVYNKWYAEGRHLNSDKIFDPKRMAKYQELERRMDYVVGASMLVSLPFLRDIGLMCEDYFLFFEELDWAMRARGKYRLALAPESIVYHKVGVSIEKKEAEKTKKKRRFNLTMDYYGTKNRLAFTLKFFPYALPVLYLSILGYVLDRLRVGAWENVWVIIKVTLGHFNKSLDRADHSFPI